MYEDTYEGEEVDNQCFFVIKAYYTMIRRITNVYEFDHWKLDENSKHYINKLLHQEIANKFAGELYICLFINRGWLESKQIINSLGQLVDLYE